MGYNNQLMPDTHDTSIGDLCVICHGFKCYTSIKDEVTCFFILLEEPDYCMVRSASMAAIKSHDDTGPVSVLLTSSASLFASF